MVEDDVTLNCSDFVIELDVVCVRVDDLDGDKDAVVESDIILEKVAEVLALFASVKLLVTVCLLDTLRVSDAESEELVVRVCDEEGDAVVVGDSLREDDSVLDFCGDGVCDVDMD